EKNGKYLFIGVYSGQMIVADFPFTGSIRTVVQLPAKASEIRKVSVRLVTSDGAKFAQGEFEFEPPPEEPRMPPTTMLTLPPTMIQLSSDATLELWIQLDDRNDEKAAVLEISRGLVHSGS